MAEQRTYKGSVYVRSGPGQEWTRQGPAQQATPSVIPLPLSPQRQRENARQDAADARSRDADARAAAAAARDQLKFDASFNPDGSPKEPEAAVTPQAITMMAQQFIASGQMPPLGMGKQAAAARQAIVNEAARLQGASGLTGADLAKQVAHYKAGQAAVRTLETQAATIGVNEQTAMANGQQFLDRSAEMPGQTPFALINSVSNWIQRHAGGETVAAMDAAYNTFYTEYAKVVAGSPSGAGTLSDSARHEAMETIRSNASLGQKQAAFRQMQADMQNRMAAINGGISTAYDKLTTTPGYQVPGTTQGLIAPPGHAGGGSGSGGGGTPSGGLTGPASMTSSPAPGGLAAAGDARKAIAVPAEMQAENARYLQEHRGHIDGDDYGRFRQRLDAQYGFPAQTNMQPYRDFAKAANAPGAHVGTDIPAPDAAMTGADKAKALLLNNPAGAFVTGAASLSGGLDEVSGALGALTGGSYTASRDQADAARRSLGNAYPVSTMAGGVAGTALDTVALGMLAPGAAAAAAARPVLTSAAYGAANGALESNDHRLYGAGAGALLGLGGGVVGSKVIAPLAEKASRTTVAQSLAKGMNSAANRFRADPVALALAPTLNQSERGISRMGPDLTGVRQNLSDAADLGLPYSLADANPKLRMLAGAVTRKSPDARALAENTFEPRALGQADRAVKAIDTHLAPVTDIAGRSSQLLAAGDQAAGPSYNLARARAAPVDPQIDAMLATPAGREALTNARTLAANEGRDPNALGFDLDDLGNVKLVQNPSFETLQYTKRGLDQVLNGHRDQFGKLDLRGNPMAQSVDSLLTRFNGRLKELNPDYAEGNALWSQWATRRDALKLGHEVLPNNSVPERDFTRAVGDLNAATLPEAQRGYATALAHQANKVRAASNPYEAIYGSPLQQQKVEALFPEGAESFGRVYRSKKI